MKVLRCGGWLRDLDIVVRGQLQIALNACAGVLRPLSLVSMRKQHYEAAQQSPFVLTRRDELVNHNLRAVCEIAELRLPERQDFGIVPTEAVFEAEHSGFGKHGVVDLEGRLILTKVVERQISLFILDIDQYGMPLVK